MIEKRAVLELAKAAVADRGLNYGKPEDNFKKIAARWNTHLINRFGEYNRITLNATDVDIMMADVKLARLEHQPNHLDSWVDLAGYAACGANINCEDPKDALPSPTPDR